MILGPPLDFMGKTVTELHKTDAEGTAARFVEAYQRADERFFGGIPLDFTSFNRVFGAQFLFLP